MDRETLVLGIEAGPPGHRPTFQDPIQLQPKIIVQTGRRVFLNEVGKGGRGAVLSPDGSRLFVKSRLAR